eukprot:jgi/Mesen1/1126/ME000123S00294
MTALNLSPALAFEEFCRAGTGTIHQGRKDAQSNLKQIAFTGRSLHLKAVVRQSNVSYINTYGTKRRSVLQASAAAAAVEAPAQVIGKQGPEAHRPTPAELARTLVEICREGTLTTLAPDGWPMGTFTHFSPDLKGRPVLRLDPQAAHKAHLDADGRCSLHVQLELPGQQRPHCTLKGRVVKAADYDSHEKLATVWERRFGADGAVAAAAAALGEDDGLCWMEVTHVFTTLDVGEEEIAISGSEYEAAEADPLRECAAKIVEDMNRDYWEDIRRFSETYGGIDDEVEEARMTWVDRLGFDMRVLTRSPQQLHEVRIPFPRPVTDDRDARSSITMMAQVAWERERHYIPPNIPLMGAQSAV